MIEAEHVRRGKKAYIIADMYVRKLREGHMIPSRGRLPLMAAQAAERLTPVEWRALAEECGQHAPSDETIGVVVGILQGRARRTWVRNS